MSAAAPPIRQDHFNPYVYLKPAAHGDVAALRELANRACQIAAQEDNDYALAEALLLARLAFARTNDQPEAMLLLSVLALAEKMDENDPENMAITQAEGIALISIMADAGIDAAEDQLPRMVADALPEAAARAKQVREMMLEGE